MQLMQIRVVMSFLQVFGHQQRYFDIKKKAKHLFKNVINLICLVNVELKLSM